MRDSAFNRWYDTTFGNVLGAQDDDNRNAVRLVWNGVIDHVSQQVAFNNFEPLSPEIVADQIRRMKEPK